MNWVRKGWLCYSQEQLFIDLITIVASISQNNDLVVDIVDNIGLQQQQKNVHVVCIFEVDMVDNMGI